MKHFKKSHMVLEPPLSNTSSKRGENMSTGSSTSLPTVLGPVVGEKLTRDNWILWNAQFLPAIRGAQLIHYLNEETVVPSTEITATTDDMKAIKIPNPEYKIWVAQDQQVLSYLLNSVTREFLGHVATKVTAASAWTALEELFASQSRAKVTNLRFALTDTKKGSMTIPQYFTKMKGFADELAASGKTLDEEEIVSYILNGLDSHYTPLVSSVMSRLEPISVNELYAQALGFESRQAKLHEADQQYLSSANSAMRGRGRGRSNGRGGRYGSSGRGRDRGHAQGGPNQRKDDRLRCQICKKPNHEALECWHMFDEEYQVEEKYAAAATPAYGVDTNRCTDT
jgi:hypothetical protein